VRFDYVPPDELEAAAFDAGHVLASIHAFALPNASSVDLFRYAGKGFSAVELVDDALAHGAATQLGPGLTQRVQRVVRDRAEWLLSQDGCLQHSDYKPWNLLVRDGRIAAVLDWEFAFAGPRLNDVGNFLRYSERQPPV